MLPLPKPILLLLILVFGVLLYTSHKTETKNNNTTIDVKFYMPERFTAGMQKAKQDQVSGKINAVLVPHHLIAGELISGIFETIKNQGIKKVVLIAPNHFEKGSGNIQVTSVNWNTPFGKLESTSLLDGYPKSSNETLVSEHSVSGLAPYIQKYLPNAKAETVIVKHYTDTKDLEELASKIVNAWDSSTILIASVDFSHYLTYEESLLKDEFTRRLLVSLQEDKLPGLSNDYMDSPGTLAVMMKVCKKLGTKAFIIKDHSSSSLVLSDFSLRSTTSYFTGYCREN